MTRYYLPTVPPPSPPAAAVPRIKRWWTFPTQLVLVAVLIGWLVSRYASLVPRGIELAVSRETSGDFRCDSFQIYPLTEQVVSEGIDWKNRYRDAAFQHATAKKIAARVSLWSLLFRRVHLSHLTLEDGAISINDAASQRVARQVFGLAPLAQQNQNTSRPLISDEVAFLLAGQLDMLTPLLAQKLQTYRVAQELQAKWQPHLDRAEQLAQTIRQRIDSVRSSTSGEAFSLALLPQIIAEVAALQQQIGELADDFARLQSQSQSDTTRLHDAVAADQRTLQSFTLPPLELDTLSQQIIGPDLVALVANLLRQQRDIFASLDGAGEQSKDKTSALPTQKRGIPISADRIDVDGTLFVGELPLYFRGVARNVTFPRDRLAGPLTAQLCIDPIAVPETVAAAPETTSHSPLYINFVSAEKDGISQDRLTIQQPRYQMPETILGDERTLAIVVGAMSVRIDATLERQEESASLALRLFSENASIRPVLSPQISELPVGQQLTTALGGLRTVVADINIQENGGEPVITVKSNVADLVTQSLQRVVAAEWSRARESLAASVNQQSAEVFAELTGTRGEAVLKSLRDQLAPLALLQQPGASSTIQAIPNRQPSIDTIWGTIRDAIN